MQVNCDSIQKLNMKCYKMIHAICVKWRTILFIIYELKLLENDTIHKNNTQ